MKREPHVRRIPIIKEPDSSTGSLSSESLDSLLERISKMDRVQDVVNAWSEGRIRKNVENQDREGKFESARILLARQV